MSKTSLAVRLKSVLEKGYSLVFDIDSEGRDEWLICTADYEIHLGISDTLDKCVSLAIKELKRQKKEMVERT